MRALTVCCDEYCRSPRRLFVLRLLTGGVLPTLPGIALGDTIAVPSDYPTIQQAIDAAQDGDEVVVAPGLYFENVDFTGKRLVVRSLEPTDPTVWVFPNCVQRAVMR